MKYILSFVLLFTSSLAFATTDNQDGYWLGTFSKKKLNDKYSFWMETQLRYNLTFGKTNQILYRTGVLQSLENKQGLGYLYGYIQSDTLKEHRLTLQHTQKYLSTQRFKFSHRIRLEGRFFEDDENDSLRLRYLIRMEQLNFQKVGLIFWNEFFRNLSDEVATEDEALERNRLFLGLKYSFLEGSHIEFGYMSQFVPREAKDVSEHLLTLYLFF